LDRKWTSIIIWPRDRASISVQQLRINDTIFGRCSFHGAVVVGLYLKFKTVLFENVFYYLLHESSVLVSNDSRCLIVTFFARRAGEAYTYGLWAIGHTYTSLTFFSPTISLFSRMKLTNPVTLATV
jgi:hypothetical protein